MRSIRWTVMTLATLLVACAWGAATNVRSPLGAILLPAAHTGAPVALRVDPDARVILSTAAGLPAASFLASQAERGAAIYERSCGTCHEPGDLIGQVFVESWNNRRVYDLYAIVRATMPLESPGSLKDAEYLDVIAYLLQANNHAALGADSLRSDTLKLRSTRIAVSVP